MRKRHVIYVRRSMQRLNEEGSFYGWCSTYRDINGFHIKGPYADPWVCYKSGLNGQIQGYEHKEMICSRQIAGVNH